MNKPQIHFDDLETANRLLNEAFDIIIDIKDILADTNISDEEALEQIDYILRKIK
jgi:hypothetical protein